jgi:sphinganine-1-phosphate aldolase
MASDTFDILRLSDALNKKGWCLNNLQYPSSIHICLTHCHTEPGVAERFVRDVRESVNILLLDPSAPVEGAVAMYGAAQTIADRSIITELTGVFLDSLYNTNPHHTWEEAN